MKKTRASFDTEKIKKSLDFLARRSFLIFILIVISSGYLAYLYLYQPVVSQNNFPVSEEPGSVKFDEDSFNGSLEEWEIKEKRLLEIGSKKYPDIFSSSTPAMAPSSSIPLTSSSTASTTVQSASASSTATDKAPEAKNQ